MSAHLSRLWLLAACMAVCLCVQGCTDQSERSLSSSVSVAPSQVTIQGGVTTTTSKAVRTDIKAFAVVAEALIPIAVFGWESLPETMTVPRTWWPLLETADPARTQERPANPYLEDAGGTEPSAQVLLTCGSGWIMVVENFRGDLGDVSGEPIGEVAGNPAHLYEVNGGLLVQWGYEGRWYGVFGRGVSEDMVVSTALTMALIERY